MKKLLWISNYGYSNSYCTVTKTLLKAFLEKYSDRVDVYLLCIGQTQHYDFAKKVASELPIPVEKIFFQVVNTFGFSNIEDNDYMKYIVQGLYHLEKVYEQVRPDIVITLNDDTPINLQKKVADKFGIELIPYITFDKDYIGSDCKIAKENYKAIITPAQHSAEQFQKYATCPIYILPHIVDSTFFSPMKNKMDEYKEKWVGDKRSFVVLAVNRNNIRKRWDILLKMFKQFSEGKRNVKLLIKTDKYDESQKEFSVINAPQYKFDYNDPQIIFIQREVSNFELNEIYNCADVGLSTTSGEGFGLTACEMSLCEVPQILPNNTTAPWIFGKDYKGLINCEQYSGSIARSFMPVEEIEKDLICILKIYPHWDDETEVYPDNKPIPITKGIYTVILCNDPKMKASLIEKGLGVYETISEVIKHVESEFNIFKPLLGYPRIQVLLNTNLKFMASLDFKELLDKKWPNRKVYKINIVHLECYTNVHGSTGLPIVYHGVELLNEFYNSEELRMKCGEECRNNVTVKFNKNVVTDCMLDLIERTASPFGGP